MKLAINNHIIDAEHKYRSVDLKKGLMYRSFLPYNCGMLLEFPTIDIHTLWMKNVIIPLSAAFCDSDLKIIKIVHMEPETTKKYSSEKPVLYALELNTDWVLDKKIKVGDYIQKI